LKLLSVRDGGITELSVKAARSRSRISAHITRVPEAAAMVVPTWPLLWIHASLIPFAEDGYVLLYVVGECLDWTNARFMAASSGACPLVRGFWRPGAPFLCGIGRNENQTNLHTRRRPGHEGLYVRGFGYFVKP
jgi:hypothetical protein